MRIGVTIGLLMARLGNRKRYVQGDGNTVKILLGSLLSRERICLYCKQASPWQPSHFYIGTEVTAFSRTNAHLTPGGGKELLESYRVSELHSGQV